MEPGDLTFLDTGFHPQDGVVHQSHDGPTRGNQRTEDGNSDSQPWGASASRDSRRRSHAVPPRGSGDRRSAGRTLGDSGPSRLRRQGWLSKGKGRLTYRKDTTPIKLEPSVHVQPLTDLAPHVPLADVPGRAGFRTTSAHVEQTIRDEQRVHVIEDGHHVQLV